MKDTEIKKLVFRESEKYKFNAINWGYSKGDTYDDICVILIDKLERIDSKEFEKPKSEIILNKLYVALTRTKGNLYIIKKSQFDPIKDNYKKQLLN